MGYISKDITLLLKIKTVPYKVWQVLNFPVPKALQKKVIKILQK